MKKISISDVLAYRRKVRFLTILAFLVVAFFAFKFISENPRVSQAALVVTETTCTFSGGNHSLNGTNSTCDNKHVVVTNSSRVVVYGIHPFNDVTVTNSSILTLDGTHTMANLRVDTNSYVNHLTVSEDNLRVIEGFNWPNEELSTRLNVTSTGGGSQYVSGGFLYHNNPSSGASSHITEYRGTVTGDFETYARYDLEIAGNNNVYSALKVSNGSNYFMVGRARTSSNYHFCERTGGSGCGTASTSDTWGFYKITRSGDYFRAYYYNTTSYTYVYLGGWTGFAGETKFSLVTYNSSSNPNFRFVWDNFGVQGVSDLTPDSSSIKDKKIDLVISGELYIGSTGKITADEIGYPSKSVKQDTSGSEGYGWGPGAGANHESGTATGSKGGGGGYGGHGVYGSAGSIGGNAYDNSAIVNFDFGSSGGYAQSDESDGYPFLRGGFGGGRIKIVAGSINLQPGAVITAVGGLGTGSAAGGWSGRGSGGTIILQFGSVTGQPLVADVRGGLLSGTNAGTGSVVARDYTYDSASTTYNIIARGGFDNINEAGAGGGGRVVLERSGGSVGNLIKKTLFAVTRPSLAAGNQDQFNPYALQDGDTIRVEIEIPANTLATTLYDEVLWTKGVTPARYCEFVPGSGATLASASPPAQIVSWPTDPATTIYSYQCKVKTIP